MFTVICVSEIAGQIALILIFEPVSQEIIVEIDSGS